MEYCQPRPAKGKWVREAHEAHGNCPGDLCQTAEPGIGETDWCTAETPCPACAYWMAQATAAFRDAGVR